MEKNQPEMKFRAGAVSATVWQNKTEIDGEERTYNTVSFARGYKDKSGEWKSTTSLRVADIPKALVVLKKAYEHLVMRTRTSQESEEA